VSDQHAEQEMDGRASRWMKRIERFEERKREGEDEMSSLEV
jgi:hypothetical protein